MTKKHVQLSASPTPNPNAVKFLTNMHFFESGTVEFQKDSEHIKESPLAEKLITIDGIDIVMIETIFDTLNCKAAIIAVKDYFENKKISLPIMISVTIVDKSGRTLSGQTLEAFWHTIKFAKPLSVGINCALGITDMASYLKELSKISNCFISAFPNAGLPNEFGEYDLGAEEMAEHIGEWASAGLVNIVGGCCGSTPDHIRAIADAVSITAPRAIPKFETKMRLSGLEPFVH